MLVYKLHTNTAVSCDVVVSQNGELSHEFAMGSPTFAQAVATGSDFLLHRDRVDRTNHMQIPVS